MKREIKTTLITDLDNTLFDWFEMWHNSFSAMVEEIIRISDVPKDQLLREIKKIHEKYKTAEYAFLIEEIPILNERFPNENLLEKFDSAIHAYRKARKHSLKLYPGVKEILSKFKSQGINVIGYTESMAFYSNYRIRHLGLDGYINYLFSPKDHQIPDRVDVNSIRRYPSSYYGLEKTIQKYTPDGELKPNPHILIDICEQLGVNPDSAVYVGDNLYKDIRMAQEAEISDVYAAYGKAHTREEYQLLVQVTHWSAAEVEHERKLKEDHVSPSFTLKDSYAELLEYFEFEAR